jgi:pyruvate/2-oxoglutarate dehydrogenase complex dihydrolipoamide dehydrogenase (E3) component
MSTNGNRRRVAGGGILIVGGHAAAELIARRLTASTSVGALTGLDPERRIAEVESDGGTVAIAYAELVLALETGPLTDALGLPVDLDGRVLVDETLRVIATPHVWALGDGAAVPADLDATNLAERLALRLRGVEGARR